jgi:hypothetical protein
MRKQSLLMVLPDVRRHGGGVVLRPKGPRSCPSYAVSNRHHLIDPIRPTADVASAPRGHCSSIARFGSSI